MTDDFTRPTPTERFFNRVIGFLIALGFGPGHMRLLEVKGRKSGRLYTLPVDVLPFEGKLYLVAPRGRTQWVRNADAQGQVVLRRGRYRDSYTLRELTTEEKPPILKTYLDSYKAEVQKFFPVQAGSAIEEFTPIAADYPVFELLD